MSYKVFLLERELGYQVTGDMSGLALMERLNMFDRYCQDNKDMQDNKSTDGKVSEEKNKLMK